MHPDSSDTATRRLAVTRGNHQRAWAGVDRQSPGLTLPLMAESLCEAMELLPGDRVLDVAAGWGVTSLSAARRGCEVTSTDFVSEMLEFSRQRAELEGLPVTFRLADAEALPFVDRQFDSVISTFGVCCSPDPNRVASELLRVCRPGGQIGLLNWSSSGILADLFHSLSTEDQQVSLSETLLFWGDVARVKSMFDPHVHDVRSNRSEYRLRFRSFNHLKDALLTDYAPLQPYLNTENQQLQECLAEWRRRCHLQNLVDGPAMVLNVEVLQLLIVR